ncbi:MAG: DUF2815 family protein [Eubacteriales bacterium]|jgi:hypothetical protein
MSNTVNPTRVVTGKVRLSYVRVFTPYQNPNGGEAKYSATILLPKNDIATKQRIDAAIAAAIEVGISKKWNGVRPPNITTPIHDGDGPRPSDGMPFSDECKGHWVFTASSRIAPQVVDAGINPIIDQTEVYSGMFGRVSLNFFPYAVSGKKGIGCGLNNVQKLEDGPPLGNSYSAEDDFGQVPQYQQPQVHQYQQPVQPQYQQPQVHQYQQPVQPQYQSVYQQPIQQPAFQPQYNQSQPQQTPQIDPITGAPIMGL